MSIMSAERATFDSSWSVTNLQSKETMRMNLSEEQFSEWEGLNRLKLNKEKIWRVNIKNNKQRLNTEKRKDALVSLVRRLQEFGEVVHEHITERRQQSEAQKAEATEVIGTFCQIGRAKVELQVEDLRPKG